MRPHAICHPDRLHFAKGLCKTCYRHQYFVLHRDQAREANHRYRIRHPERERERHRKYVGIHRERVRLWGRQYYWKRAEEMRQKAREWRAKHRDVIRESKRRCHLKRKYNLSPEEYGQIFLRQDGRCAICGRAKPLQVDHDHTTGKIRGLLCATCNLAIGGIEASSAEPSVIVRYLRISNM
jgi:hypothetical protein